MWQYTYRDELYHYGVLGMKWGVRKPKYDNQYTDLITKKSKFSNDKESDDALRKNVEDIFRRERLFNKMVNKVGDSPYSDNFAFTEAARKAKKDYHDSLHLLNRKYPLVGLELVEARKHKKYMKEYRELKARYVDTMAGITLQELGYRNTEKGREYVKEYLF